jgi:hypothetical protein
MALGKQVGEFTLTVSSTTLTPGADGTPLLQHNYQGQVSGELEGLAFGTLNLAYEPGMKRGTWTWCGLTLFNKGGGNTVNGQGTWQEAGPLKWRLRGTDRFSDGLDCGIEADMEVAAGTNTLSGKLYEWS